MEVAGTGAKGRPRMRWMDSIRHDMNTCVLEEGKGRPGEYSSSIVVAVAAAAAVAVAVAVVV